MQLSKGNHYGPNPMENPLVKEFWEASLINRVSPEKVNLT